MASVVCASHYSNSWIKRITDLEKISRIDKMIDALFLVHICFFLAIIFLQFKDMFGSVVVKWLARSTPD